MGKESLNPSADAAFRGQKMLKSCDLLLPLSTAQTRANTAASEMLHAGFATDGRSEAHVVQQISIFSHLGGTPRVMSWRPGVTRT